MAGTVLRNRQQKQVVVGPTKDGNISQNNASKSHQKSTRK